ncbi:MAG: universal stress protein [Gammaproteobacteria bacterium]|jgi:universal stress protein E|nr:universal stress protein [Gammaproteobacteria bacterium]MBT3866630.1 universal stress protein [Gammaproteobacteria bacterium]MBT4379247.1 universal stress protein [Gammaproteobacteria bacterium]MBT5198552.1 universal stress protein [Gammaproteobacteria bacterium]MBT5792923.1 universal stress protein [Gammaproteobacteria bacterium]
MTRILVVLDPNDDKHLALERSKELPPDSDLDIHVVLFIQHESANVITQTFKERTDWLDEQVRPYIDDGYRMSTEVVLFSNLYESVIVSALKLGADFVLKPMRQHSLFSTMLRTSTDWNLIRHCPVPLLLVSPLESTHGKPVLAAVDVCSGDDYHDDLNRIVLSQAQRIARVLGSDCALVNAYRIAMPALAVGTIDTMPLPTSKELILEREVAIQALETGAIAENQMYVEEGNAAVAINQTARNLNAGLIVIGTVGRQGLSGSLIGNTAESVIEGTSVDVLVVKLPKPDE